MKQITIAITAESEPVAVTVRKGEEIIHEQPLPDGGNTETVIGLNEGETVTVA